MVRRVVFTFAMAAAVLLLQPGCYLTRAAKQQERSRLRAELQTLEQLHKDLSDGNFPGGSQHVKFKISYDLLNQILAGADGMEAALPEDRDVVIRVDEIRFRGRSATPLLDLRGSAHKWGVTVGVTATAMLDIDRSDPAAPMFRVRIVDIAPALTWRQFTLRRMELARKVLVTEADKLAINYLAFPIPLEQAIRLDIPAVAESATVPTRNNGSWIRYSVRKPASQLQRVIAIDRIVFLGDGIHLFATVS